MNAKDSIELILGVLALVGIVYQIARIEHSIYEEIDSLKDSILARMAANETRFDVHIQDYTNRKESVDYKLGGLDEKIKHKAERHNSELRETRSELKEMQRFMEKQFTFRIRKEDEDI